MKKRGRPTKLNAELTQKICGLLSEGISITATCDALGITESRFYNWQKQNEDFREELTRARAKGKIALVRRIVDDKDWRALSWYLSVCWPNEFGRTVERKLPKEPESEAQGPSVEFSVSLRDGTRIPSSFEQLQKVFANFPVVERPEELAKNCDDEVGSNEDESGSAPNEYPNESPS
jgi:hypothetical protein